MNKGTEKKFVEKLILASNAIERKRQDSANWVISKFYEPKKFVILKVKEWLEEEKRKKKLNSTNELIKDLKDLHGFDAERELIKILTEEINKITESEKRKKGI